MRVAINLLTEDPEQPFGCPLVLDTGDSRDGQAARVRRGTAPAGQPEITAPPPGLRTERLLHHLSMVERAAQSCALSSEHLYSPLRLPLSRIDVFNTLMAPLVNFSWSLVIHIKTMHAFTAPEAITAAAPALPAAELPALRAGRGRDHHQLREPALGDQALPRTSMSASSS